MMKRFAALVLLMGALSVPVSAQTTDADDASVADAPAQIHVTGQRPGPGLWKVTHGEHVLWVFGTYAPLPKKMQWRSQKVEQAIAASQEYIGPPGGEVKAGIFQTVLALPSLIGADRNPDGVTLRELLSEQDYAHWQALRRQYGLDDDGIERKRPVVAAQQLTRAAREQAGLVPDQAVRKQVLSLVKKYKLKETPSKIMLPVENARATIKTFKRHALGDEVCLVSTMNTIEPDIAHARERAQAWAMGDIAQLRRLNLGADRQACFESMLGSVAFDSVPAMRTAQQDSHALWLKNAEQALATNRSSFALLSMTDILAPRGLLARLAEKGYTVQAPD